jgi:hypothetical protein
MAFSVSEMVSMNEYAFEVKVRAVVRVRAPSKADASKVIESVLGAPGAEEKDSQTRTMQARVELPPYSGLSSQRRTRPNWLPKPRRLSGSCLRFWR